MFATVLQKCIFHFPWFKLCCCFQIGQLNIIITVKPAGFDWRLNPDRQISVVRVQPCSVADEVCPLPEKKKTIPKNPWIRFSMLLQPHFAPIDRRQTLHFPVIDMGQQCLMMPLVAEQAGLRDGDVIVALNDTSFSSSLAWANAYKYGSAWLIL